MNHNAMKLDVTIPTTPDVIREVWTEDVYRIQSVGKYARGGIVLDLGANVGVFSLYMLLKYGARKVVSVEPLPSNIEALRANLGANSIGSGRSTIIEAAVVGWKRDLGMASTGAQAYIMDPAAADWHRKALGQEGLAPRVKGLTIDELMERGELSEIDVLKVDVEGAEFEAILGASDKALAACKFITVETGPSMPGAFGMTVERLTETHHVTTLGTARRGAYIYATRYNL